MWENTMKQLKHFINIDKYGLNDEYSATCPKCGHIEKSEIYWDKNKGKCARCEYKQVI